MNYHVYVISAGRPQAVEKMAPQLFGPQRAWWVVPEHETQAYVDAGARVIADPGSLTGARNLALEHAFADGVACVQVSDDLKKIKAIGEREFDLNWALNELDAALSDTALHLAGCAPTDNLYFAKPGISTRKFVVGDLIMVRPTHLRFDENLRLKEDYDFTLQHWATYGGAARCDYIAPSFAHYKNAGGAVAVRTEALEQATIAYLKEKWPGMLRDNPRRPNEILLTTPRRHR